MIKPMLAKPADARQVDEFLDHDGWIITPKVDGQRILVSIDDKGAVKAFTRQGLATFLPSKVEAELSHLRNMAFDGELLGGVLFVFDVLRITDFETVWGPALEWRLDFLNGYFTSLSGLESVRLMPAARTADEKRSMLQWIIDGRGEGIVAKQAVSPYTPGKRSTAWRKVKRHHEIDCVVTWLGMDPSLQGDEDDYGHHVATGKQNFGVGVYRDDELVEIGEVSRLVGDGPKVKPGDVVAVRCLYATDDNRLYQPTLPRLRTDKLREECTFDQLADAATNKKLILDWVGA